MDTNLDINLIRDFSKSIENKTVIKSIIGNKSDFKGFSGRFSQNKYDLYLALRLNFQSENIWVAFGNGWKVGFDYIYMYDSNKNLIIEKALNLNEFIYTQKPTKQDGKNKLRQERFIEMNGDLEYQLSYPKNVNDVGFFLKEIQSLTLMKMAADNISQSVLKDTLFNNIETEILDLQEQYSEGGSEKRLSNYYERNPKLRVQAIRIHGLDCMVCGFNYQNKYGHIGESFIEVHHLVPISTLSNNQLVNPRTDLVCVCANCHRMLHRNGEVKSIEDLQKIISGNQ